MLMETIGDAYVANLLEDKHESVSNSRGENDPQAKYILESIHLTYMSQGKNNVSFKTELDDFSKKTSSLVGLNVTALDGKGKVISEGTLRYRRLG
jgi:hypothetical protein